MIPRSFSYDGGGSTVSYAYGTVSAEEGDCEVKECIKRAEIAPGHVKHSYEEDYAVHDDTFSSVMNYRVKISFAWILLSRKSVFYLYLQHILDTSMGEVYGFESLAGGCMSKRVSYHPMSSLKWLKVL